MNMLPVSGSEPFACPRLWIYSWPDGPGVVQASYEYVYGGVPVLMPESDLRSIQKPYEQALCSRRPCRLNSFISDSVVSTFSQNVEASETSLSSLHPQSG